MDTEQLVRDTLARRADDVEPTPVLWGRVSRRIDRRRRWAVLAWIAAGVTAMVVAAVAVPAIVGEVRQDPTPEVADEPPSSTVGAEAPEIAAGAEVPPAVVTVEDGELVRTDLATGQRDTLETPEGEVTDVAVRPGSDPEALELVVALDSDISVGLAYEGTRLVAQGQVPGETSPTFSPGGRHLAWIEEGPNRQRGLVGVTSVDDDFGAFVQASTGRIDTYDPGGGVLLGVLDWTGSDATGGTSELWVDTSDGPVVQPFEVRGGDAVAVAESAPLTVGGELVGGGDAKTAAADGVGPTTLLTDAGHGLELSFNPTSGAEDEGGAALPLPEAVAAADPYEVTAFDTRADATVVGTEEGAWLVTHDGEAGDGTVTQLGEGGASSASFVAPDPAAADADADATEDEGPGTEEPTEPDEQLTPDDDAAATSDDPTGLVTADERTLTLHRDRGDPVELATLPAEGESTIAAVSVRPGSSADDLTAAVLTRAEGMLDVRLLRVYGDEENSEGLARLPRYVRFEPIEQPESDGDGAPLTMPDRDEASVPSPVWSPDGETLAWVAPLADGGSELRAVTVGDVHADVPVGEVQRLDLDTEEALRAQDWITFPGGGEEADLASQGALLLTDESEANAGYQLPVETSADGAVALADGSEAYGVGEPGLVELEGADPVFDLGSSSVGDLLDTAVVSTGDGETAVRFLEDAVATGSGRDSNDDGRNEDVAIDDSLSGPGGEVELQLAGDRILVGFGPRFATMDRDDDELTPLQAESEDRVLYADWLR